MYAGFVAGYFVKRGGVINFSVSIITACVTMPINTLLRVLCHQFTLAKLAVFTLHAYARGGG